MGDGERYQYPAADTYLPALLVRAEQYTTDEFDPDPYMEALNKWGLPWKVVENPVLVD